MAEALKAPNPAVPAGAGSGNSARECFLVVLGIVVFVLINILTADKSPAVWCDEVMYQDPAVNLYQGHGFTSGAWYAQTVDKFWAGNVPLYQFALFGWLKIFGFSLVTVRSFHYVFFGLAAIVGWSAIRRLGLVPSPRHRLLFCLLLLLCSSSAFVYRYARPESLCLLLTASAVFCFSIRARAVRLSLLAICGGLLIWSGLQMGPYLFLMGSLVWAMGPRRFRLETAVLCAGCVAGMGLLYLFYTGHGVWGDFVTSIRRHTLANQGMKYDVIPGYGVGVKDKIKKLPQLYADYSFLPFAIVSAWIGWRLVRARRLDRHSPFLFGALTMLVVPLALYAIGVFPPYYFWMAFLPLALGVCAELGRLDALQPSRLARWLLALMLFGSCFLGLPRRLAVAAFDWRGRTYGPVVKLAAPNVPASATVFSEFAAYYAAKQAGALVLLPPYLPIMRDSDKQQLSAAIVHTRDADGLARDYGGEWRRADSLAPPTGRRLMGFNEQLGSQQYDLTVFVRVK